ncbi:hypothetical protein D1007_40016 [Hordeum vulgare]|nr:hypothetical protein D1007_40016 [Hordeum vulgare]
MGESGESGEGTNGDKGGTNGDKSSPCGGSVAASRSGAGSAQTVISSGGDGQQIPSGMDPAIAFFLSIRMETTVLVCGGTKGKHCGFSFPLVVECTSSYTNFRAAICAKYPWGLFDAVEIRYWNSSKLCWVPVQCDAELGVVFPSAVDYRNAVASFSIKSETEFLTLKSDPTRFTVKCAYERCKWRLHASLMRNSTLFQIKVNTYQHTCPSVNRSQRLRAAKRRWIEMLLCHGSEQIQELVLRKFRPAESFNSRIKKYKSMNIVDLLDKIRQYIMEKFDLRNRIAMDHFIGHSIIPAVMKVLMEKTRGLQMSIVRRSPTEAEVTATDSEKREWRYPVDLEKWSCSCRQWQITGKPCIHALFFITSLRGEASGIDQYVHKYYSFDMFRATYAENIPALEGKQQWDIVDPGFKLCAPIQARPPGRPRKQRIRSSTEGKGLGPRKYKCKRCDNADDHPTTNEPAQAEIQEEEEEEDETTPDVQQQMPPPKEPSHDASTEASCAVSPRKNYKRVAGRGPSPRCVKQNIGVELELESKGSSPKRAATTVEAPNPAKNTRSKAMQAPNPAKNTRSKKLMF